MTKMALSPLDIRWLALESKGTPMHLGSLAVFKKPAKAPSDFLQSLVQSLRSEKNVGLPWNLRLTKPFKLTRIPKMTSDKNIDLGYHFRHSALPAPGGERELGILVSHLHSIELDKSRPLWECHIIEGLENKRFAIYFKIHPCILRGGNAINTMMKMLSTSPRNRKMSPLWSLKPDFSTNQNSREAAQLLETVGSLGKNLASAGKAAKMLLSNTGKLKAPRSYLNKTNNNQRRFATQQYDESRILTIADKADCSPNTIIAFLCSSALRRFFKEYNALPDKPLIASVPLDLNDYVESNNKETLATIRIPLATNIADPIRRLQTIKDSAQSISHHLQQLTDEAISSYAILSSLPVLADQVIGLGRLIPNLFNVGISNTEGSDAPLYLYGAKLEAIYPMAHLMQNSALSIDCISYSGTINIGITGARDTLPRLQRMALYMEQALTTLETQLSSAEESAA
jgi:diacylglycerol O-acyltransferase